jgi:crotonobetainyl-CoA:carnitine CoA-transferase CaiB-like acyl-CoA transferase
MDVDEVVARLEAADVPCAKAHSLDELPAHPQMQANGLFVESEHPVAGRLLEPRSPVRFGGTPTGCGFPSAALGQHSDEILRELGFDANTVAGWREKGVIG